MLYRSLPSGEKDWQSPETADGMERLMAWITPKTASR